MPVVYISIGSNVNAEENICAAITALKSQFTDIKTSTVYQNKAVGFEGDDFLNLVVEFETDLPILKFVDVLHQIEAAQGRVRELAKFSPRTLDMDLLLYGTEIFTSPAVTIPRDEITRYAFVLQPLCELAANYHHPVLNKTVSKIWEDFDKSSLQMTAVNLPI